MKIGILTFHRAYNCGAVLQAWALRKVLVRMGHSVEFPVCNHVGENDRWQVPWVDEKKIGVPRLLSRINRMVVNLSSFPHEDLLRRRYRHFRAQFLPERMCSPEEFDKYYDVVVSGSDQVFSDTLTNEYSSVFLCENKPPSVRAVAYAASYGDVPLKGPRLSRLVHALDNFNAVSVRESMAREQLSKASGRNIDETIDPTLLLTADDYGEIARGHVPKVPYLFMYTLFATPYMVNLARELSGMLKVKCVIAPCYQYSRIHAARGLTYAISPDRLVQYARNAKYILANSFHGTVMGVVFGKSFLSVRENVDEHESRAGALLRKIGMMHRLVNPKVSILEMKSLLETPLEPKGDLEALRESSLNWLHDNCECQ